MDDAMSTHTLTMLGFFSGYVLTGVKKRLVKVLTGCTGVGWNCTWKSLSLDITCDHMSPCSMDDLRHKVDRVSTVYWHLGLQQRLGFAFQTQVTMFPCFLLPVTLPLLHQEMTERESSWEAKYTLITSLPRLYLITELHLCKFKNATRWSWSEY